MPAQRVAVSLFGTVRRSRRAPWFAHERVENAPLPTQPLDDL